MKKFKKPDVRFLNEIKNVLYDRKWAKKSSNFPLYYMRRGIKEKNGLRYDITIIPPRLLGKEFVKTKGHEHFGDWREIYIVLEGKAIYLMQKTKNKKVLEEVEEDKSSSPPLAAAREVEEDKSSSPPLAAAREVEEDKSSSLPFAIARERDEAKASSLTALLRRKSLLYDA